MSWVWPLLGGFELGVPAGFGLCLTLAAIVRKRPMDGARYTGGLGEDHDDYDQFLRDLNHQGDAA